jgi:hypothetical protein
MKTQGYGFFITEPNAYKSLECNICGVECLVERNLPAKSGFISAMARMDKPRDEFSCPNLEEEWHEQAVQLVMEIEKTPSKRIAHLMQQDLEDLLHENNSH